MSGRQQASALVVVGVDGSRAAVRAAVWAVDEVLSRKARLRLIHVISPRYGRQDERGEFENGAAALRAAHGAIKATGKPIQLETAIVYGDVGSRLLKESCTADLISVGSVGFGSSAPTVRGRTVATLAKSAQCPVAIIGADDASRCSDGCIAVVVDDSADNDTVVHQAMEEARLRQASLLALGVRRRCRGGIDHEQPEETLGAWMRRYPDVRVHLVAARRGAAQFLADNDQSVQLAVIGKVDGERIERFIGPGGDVLADRARRSILVVRH